MQISSSVSERLTKYKLILLSLIFSLCLSNLPGLYVHGLEANQMFFGVNMKGFYTSLAQTRNPEDTLPPDYFDESFKLISEAGMNHVRFVFYWEAYERNPLDFIRELESVAQTADKWNIKVIYDNHQFHTSSWLNPQRGTGFPHFLFQDNPSYVYGSGGGPKYTTGKTWWTDWWNKAVVAAKGTDGWLSQLEFLKTIVNTVDGYESTLGYEILSEPQVHSSDEWEKIGRYNTFMVNELRKFTSKILVYSMNIPVDLKSAINLTSENIAKMAPDNPIGIVFKISLYGLPTGSYQEDRLNTFIGASKMTGIPIYVGEWNNVLREKSTNEEGISEFKINPSESDISQSQADLFLKTFKDLGIWGLAYWKWDFDPHEIQNFNLISVDKDGDISTNKYFKQLKTALANNDGN